MDARKKRKILIVVAVLVALGAIVAFTAWYKLCRDVPQPAWITADQRDDFLYGSMGGEGTQGMPYWIWLVLPRMFPEYLPGPGGYASLGLPWEEGKEMPAGFSKKTVGFVRVGQNCAICHSTSYRTREDEVPKVVPAGPGHTADIQGLINFFMHCAGDPRFNADDLLAEIDLVTRLSPIDRLLYRFALIPRTRQALIDQGKVFSFASRRPAWGPGRDAPMNLTKFVLLAGHDDGTIDNTDFPAIWHLSAREQAGRTWDEKTPDPVPAHTMLMNLDGATTSFRSVLIDSALGIGATNTPFFNRRIQELLDWLRKFTPPPFPLPIDAPKAARGKAVFETQCAACHAPGRDNRMGRVIPIAEVGTDRERLDAWTEAAADGANAKVASLGIRRTPMIKTQGYIAVQLDGLWLRGPYLHNGSVPTVRDLLEPVERRPRTFFRGYDVIDAANLGYLSTVAVEKGRRFFLLDTRQRGNGNGGHLYGTALPPGDKDDLLEYLKTL